jgi:hypothetical protein
MTWQIFSAFFAIREAPTPAMVKLVIKIINQKISQLTGLSGLLKVFSGLSGLLKVFFVC